jgi:hypothetical protein
MDHRKRKRNRTIRSCVPCHNHKRKVSFGHWFFFTIHVLIISVIESDPVADAPP